MSRIDARAAARSETSAPLASTAPDDRERLLVAKARRPEPRAGLVPRRDLVDRMLSSLAEPLVAVVAPPGYGKTTVLSQWSAQHVHDVGWLSMDEGDNEPSVLLAAAALAFGEVGHAEPAIVDSLISGPLSISKRLAVLAGEIARHGPVAVVADNLDLVTNMEALDVLFGLVLRLPPGSQFAYASRAPVPLPKSLSRPHAPVLVIGVADLAMDRAETGELLDSMDVALTDDEVDELFRTTEGWPVGIYLAGLASRDRRDAVTRAFAFRGDDVLMADYLRTEILAHMPAETVALLTRTALLEQVSGPLCDAVVGTTGSQAVLEGLAASNLLVVPLDRHGAWFRYQRLWRDLLATELERREPGVSAQLHRRAADWLETHGLREQAIAHAQRCGDADYVARLVRPAIQPAYASGRADQALGWLEWFRAEGLIDEYPALAILGAMVEAFAGHTASAERWAASAEAGRGAETSEGSDTEAHLAYLSAILCRAGTARMRADARRAQDLMRPNDNMRAGALVYEACAHVLDGDLELAEPLLAHAYDVSMYLGAMPAAIGAIALRALCAIDRGDWESAQTFADRAVDLTRSYHLQDYQSAGYAHVVAARTALHGGHRATATEHLDRCARLRHLFTYAVPITAIVQLQMISAYIELGDPAGARSVMRELRDLLQQRVQLAAVVAAADALEQRLDAMRHGPLGTSSLTAAELRLVPYLATHLSFREIGDRLNVSRHTVKTQAAAVYRKVGASSRSEAIGRLGETGLLAG